MNDDDFRKAKVHFSAMWQDRGRVAFLGPVLALLAFGVVATHAFRALCAALGWS